MTSASDQSSLNKSATRPISLSSHVLDTTLGKPVAGLHAVLTLPDGQTCEASTNEDGRITQWQVTSLPEGQYQLRFHTEPYLLHAHGASFYPYVDIHFIIAPNSGHYHVPLLLSPFGFSSYRGS